jgi:hypothetical protein
LLLIDLWKVGRLPLRVAGWILRAPLLLQHAQLQRILLLLALQLVLLQHAHCGILRSPSHGRQNGTRQKNR